MIVEFFISLVASIYCCQASPSCCGDLATQGLSTFYFFLLSRIKTLEQSILKMSLKTLFFKKTQFLATE